jgi:hypothetical protein
LGGGACQYSKPHEIASEKRPRWKKKKQKMKNLISNIAGSINQSSWPEITKTNLK